MLQLSYYLSCVTLFIVVYRSAAARTNTMSRGVDDGIVSLRMLHLCLSLCYYYYIYIPLYRRCVVYMSYVRSFHSYTLIVNERYFNRPGQCFLIAFKFTFLETHTRLVTEFFECDVLLCHRAGIRASHGYERQISNYFRFRI